MTFAEATMTIPDGVYRVRRATQMRGYCWVFRVQDRRVSGGFKNEHANCYRAIPPDWSEWTPEEFEPATDVGALEWANIRAENHRYDHMYRQS